MTDNKEKNDKAIPNKSCIVTFKSVAYAMQFEKLMKSNNIEFKLIPVPRSISSSCGMCGKFNMEMKDIILDLCDKNKISYDTVHDFFEN